MKEYIVGIDIGGTKCAVILGKEGTGDYCITDRICFDTEVHRGPDYTIERLKQTVHEVLDKHGLENGQIEAVGISCGGPLDHIRGVIKNPPNLYGWMDIPIVDIIEQEFHIPAYIQNDANACALAEWRFGAAKGYQNVIFLTFGTGLGAGLILDGRLYNGANSMAGEVGHVRLAETGPVGFGKAGSFEGFCSGGGIAQIAKIKVLERLQRGEKPAICPDLAHMEELSARTVAQAAKEGDELALDIYAASGYYLGKGLSILVDILNPEMIVLGSIFERSGELLSPAMYEVLGREALDISRKDLKIVPAKLGNQIGDYAALSVAIEGGRHEGR